MTLSEIFAGNCWHKSPGHLHDVPSGPYGEGYNLRVQSTSQQHQDLTAFLTEGFFLACTIGPAWQKTRTLVEGQFSLIWPFQLARYFLWVAECGVSIMDLRVEISNDSDFERYHYAFHVSKFAARDSVIVETSDWFKQCTQSSECKQ